MNRIIKIPERPRDEVDDSKVTNSPHVLDLNEPSKPVKKKVVDMVAPEREKDEIRIIAEKPRRSIFAKHELLRMAAIATLIVVCLNVGQAAFRANATKNDAINAAYAGYEALLDVDPTNIEETSSAFDYALYQFAIAENMIWYLVDSPEGISGSNKYISTAEGLINVGSSVSSAGQYFTQFVSAVTEVGGGLLEEGSEGKPSLTEALDEAFVNYLTPAFEDLERAELYLQEVDIKILPDEYQEQVALAKSKMTELNDLLEKLTVKFPLILQLLGDQHPQTYMILLENNSELRPGGGFIGSFLTLDLNDGYIDNMEFHDIYDWDGAFNEYIEPPVEEIEYLTCCWGLRDANYSPDFAISAEQTAWFFEHEGGPTVDNVLMVDLSFVRDLIAGIGGIYSPTLDGELTGDNFELILSYYVESKLHGADNPKGILEEIIPLVQEKILREGKFMEVMEVLVEGVKGKHLAAYSRNPNHQGLWESLNLDAETYSPGENEDYLMVTVSGIGGNKTDHYILQNINHQTLLSKEGTALDKVTITRNHTYDYDTELWQQDVLSDFGFDTISSDVRNILGAGDNVAGIRVYIPMGSELQSATGDLDGEVKILNDPDLGLDYFYAQVTTPAGGETHIEFTYSVPVTLTYEPVDDYFLFVDKQPGMDNTIFTKQIIAPNLTDHALYPPELIEQEDLSYHYETALDQNIHLGGVFGD